MADVRTVIAVTGEDERYATVRRAAIKRAIADQRATLILYDIDAGQPAPRAPPTGWSAEGTEGGGRRPARPRGSSRRRAERPSPAGGPKHAGRGRRLGLVAGRFRPRRTHRVRSEGARACCSSPRAIRTSTSRRGFPEAEAV